MVLHTSPLRRFNTLMWNLPSSATRASNWFSSLISVVRSPEIWKVSSWRRFIFSICRKMAKLFITTHKRSLGQGKVFTPVCLFTGGLHAGGICIQGVLPTGVCIQGESASRGNLHPRSSAYRGLHPGGICIQGVLPTGICIQGESGSRGNLHPGSSAYRGLHPGGICIQGESASREFCLQGSASRGNLHPGSSAYRGLHPGGICIQEGLPTGRSISRRGLPKGDLHPGGVCLPGEGVCLQVRLGRSPSHRTGKAGGKHPTGILSCFFKINLKNLLPVAQNHNFFGN